MLTVLIAFSRMYLGVHTPLDVGVSFLIATALVLLVYPLMEEADRRPVVLTYTILAMVVCSGAFVGYLYLRGDTGAAAEDTANYLSALENGWKLLGATVGMLVSNIADRKTSGSRHRRCGGRRSSSWQWALPACWPYAPG